MSWFFSAETTQTLPDVQRFRDCPSVTEIIDKVS